MTVSPLSSSAWLLQDILAQEDKVANNFIIHFGNILKAYLFYLLIYLLSFRAATSAYGSSQPRRRIRAVTLAYTTATEMQDPSHACDLHHRSWQRWILTQGVRPGIEAPSSRMLAGFVSAAPSRELLHPPLCFENNKIPSNESVCDIQICSVGMLWVTCGGAGESGRMDPRKRALWHCFSAQKAHSPHWLIS